MDMMGKTEASERTRACAWCTLDPCPYRHDRHGHRVRGCDPSWLLYQGCYKYKDTLSCRLLPPYHDVRVKGRLFPARQLRVSLFHRPGFLSPARQSLPSNLPLAARVASMASTTVVLQVLMLGFS